MPQTAPGVAHCHQEDAAGALIRRRRVEERVGSYATGDTALIAESDDRVRESCSLLRSADPVVNSDGRVEPQCGRPAPGHFPDGPVIRRVAPMSTGASPSRGRPPQCPPPSKHSTPHTP